MKPGLDGKKAILFKRNTELSQRDKEFIGKLYPKPSAYPNVTKKPQDQPLNQLPSTTERPRLEYDSGSQAQVSTCRYIQCHDLMPYHNHTF